MVLWPCKTEKVVLDTVCQFHQIRRNNMIHNEVRYKFFKPSLHTPLIKSIATSHELSVVKEWLREIINFIAFLNLKGHNFTILKLVDKIWGTLRPNIIIYILISFRFVFT